MTDGSGGTQSILEQIAERVTSDSGLADMLSSEARQELKGMLVSGKDLKLVDLQKVLNCSAGGDCDEDSESDHQ